MYKMDHKIASHNTFIIIEYRECVIIKKNLQKDFKKVIRMLLTWENMEIGNWTDDDETGLRELKCKYEIRWLKFTAFKIAPVAFPINLL